MKHRKPKKYQSVITKRIFHSVKKLSAVLVLALCATSVLTIGGTNAGFSDIEESTGNTFTATSLDARATYVERFSVTGMNPSQKPDQRIAFTNEGVLEFRYGVEYRMTAGDDLLCEALLLTAERDGVKVYNKLPLKDFNIKEFASNPFVLTSAENDDWDFTVELPADAGATLEHLSCQWSFDFTAWQTALPDGSTGFSDVEAVGTHSIATGEWLTPGDVVINEVMWMGSAGHDTDEWIELKNMTGSPISLAGWKLENASSAADEILTIPAGKVLPANGYFLIANYSKSNASSALDVEADWVTTTIQLNNTNNGNIVLKSPTNLVVDSALSGATWPAGTNGALKQSMERNDIPGDGLLAGSWHPCVSGAANGAPYWDAAGVNYGTPKAANLSPIVMNEFVLNPVDEDDADRPEGEWIELYNIVDEDIDVAGWYFTNLDGDMIAVTEDNTGSDTTVVPAKGALVVYLEEAFLDNTADTLSLYAPGVLPEDASDDVREDTYTYEDADLLSEGKSYARFPDGEGIWIDPEATPGEENVMVQEDVQIFRRLTYTLCFENEKLKKDATEEMCSPIFLTYIGMLEVVDETKIPDSVLLDILGVIRLEEEEKLLALLGEDGVLSPEELALVPVVEIEEEETTEPIIEDEESEESQEPTETVTPVEETTPETDPIEAESPEPVEGETPTETPVEEGPAPETEPVVEEEEAKETPEAKVEETASPEPVEDAPADEPAAPASETP